MRETFGVDGGGGIRPSRISTDIIIVRSVNGDSDDVEEGKRIIHDGAYYDGADQMIDGNLRLAKSRENGSRVLYFVEGDAHLTFGGIVECVAHHDRGDTSRPGALAFELAPVDAAGAARQGARADGHGDPPRPRMPSAPDLDMIMEVEREIFDRRRFAHKSELLAALHAGIDSAKLDLILEYLERSEKIATSDGSIRWSFGRAGPPNGPSAGRKDAGTLADVDEGGERIHILSMEERLSADLDNDLPYSKDIEHMIAYCRAGRAIGSTYTAEECLGYLDREFGDGALGNSA